MKRSSIGQVPVTHHEVIAGNGLPHDSMSLDMMQDAWSIQAGDTRLDNEFRIRQ
jgi:hypothetical protein